MSEQLPNITVWAYGSRVKGLEKCYSDLKLAIMNESPLTFLLRANLEEAFFTVRSPLESGYSRLGNRQ